MERSLRPLLVDGETELQMLVDLICLQREKEILLGQGWHVDELKRPTLVHLIADSLDHIPHLIVGDLDLLVGWLLVGCSCKVKEEQEHDGYEYFRFHCELDI